MQLKAHKLAYFWQNLFGLNLTVELVSDKALIIITRNGYALEFPLIELAEIKVERSLFLTELSLTFSEQKPIVLKGYSAKDVLFFVDALKKSLIHFTASLNVWEQVAPSLLQFKQKETYFSSEEWQSLVHLQYLVEQLSRLGIRPRYLSLPLHQQIFQQALCIVNLDMSQLGRKQYNQLVVENLVKQYANFFNAIESQPLTEKQRIACVTNDTHTLLIAGAGTGKTATLVSKAGFLIKANLAKAENILMLSFGVKAAEEMKTRVANRLGAVGNRVTVSTFHALGNEVIQRFGDQQCTISPLSMQASNLTHFLHNTVQTLMNADDDYKNRFINYLLNFSISAKSELDFKTITDYHAFLSSCRLITFKGEWVNHIIELRIANYLAIKKVNYQYKPKNNIGYQPIFYLPDADIYFDYVAVNEKFETAPFVDQQAYLKDVEYRRAIHNNKNISSKRIEFYAFELTQNKLTEKLDKLLIKNKIKTQPIDIDSLFNQAKLQYKTQWQSLIELFQRFLVLYKEGNFNLAVLAQQVNSKDQHIEIVDAARSLAFFKLFEPVLTAYQTHLKQSDTLDYSDMITTASAIIENGHYIHHFNYILVDEFQDISAGRARLLKALLASKPNMRLFAVGDDWQSIYRFNGADMSLFTEFNQHFSPSTAISLDKSFRFNNKIQALTNEFITKNPAQLQKQLKAHTQIDIPAVHIIDIQTTFSAEKHTKTQYDIYDKALIDSLTQFDLMAQQSGRPANVLLIGRFGSDKMTLLKHVSFNHFTHLTIRYVTAHASKGLEADYVVLIGVELGQFPSIRENDELIDLVLPKKESFLYAEERRLFYVGLTRAKNCVHILFNSVNESPFIDELLKLSPELISAQLAEPVEKWNCPSCHVGELKLIKNAKLKRAFYKCSLAPVCLSTYNECLKCNSPANLCLC